MTDEDIIEKALEILASRLRNHDVKIRHPADATSYFKLQMMGLEHESFRVMYLNSQHEMIEYQEMSRGTINSAVIYPREVVKAALDFNAAAVIVSHNHPSGCCEPSQADRQITQRLKDALDLVDIKVLDHVVIGGRESYSFAEYGIL